ncbi:NUDIX domain-containing protein [Gluconacetobacter entanii]|nr:NUDIX domain-containing protein [Gluconacetobacter entanii]MCE2578719.1 NUDIX domain-containing protein [Komagataeibacter sp. FNDCR1]MCW4579579.1 NUDIX domain-containing protein [Gluconacetobacter entanii]MCW4582985.1 NUDIX domain-containing protein [Gluconacetobacter entanii]MCW4586385.1 NUDIX domain-containing protein [Gluconacetobacter entanii]
MAQEEAAPRPARMTDARVGCGALVRRGDGRILLVRRRRPPEAGHWGLPGGKVDWMETVEHAVRREVAEETGLVIRLTRLLCVVDHITPATAREDASHWVAPVYLATPITSARALLCEPEALSAVRWFEPDDLPTPLTLATRVALRALADAPA